MINFVASEALVFKTYDGYATTVTALMGSRFGLPPLPRRPPTLRWPS